MTSPEQSGHSTHRATAPPQPPVARSNAVEVMRTATVMLSAMAFLIGSIWLVLQSGFTRGRPNRDVARTVGTDPQASRQQFDTGEHFGFLTAAGSRCPELDVRFVAFVPSGRDRQSFDAGKAFGEKRALELFDQIGRDGLCAASLAFYGPQGTVRRGHVDLRPGFEAAPNPIDTARPKIEL